MRKIYEKIISLFRGNSNRGLPPDVETQLAESIEAFKNRPIHQILTDQIIDETADEELVQVVFDNLSAKLGDYSEEFEIVMSWNKSQRAIYQIWLLEAEVNNGGYNQFYFNSSGQFYPYLPEALRLVGAVDFADLTEKANTTFEEENETIIAEMDGTLEGFMRSYDNNPLCEYDDKFYKLYESENLNEIQIDFVRRNKSDFVDK